MVVDEMGMGEVYKFPWVALGEEPSVVYRMLAPGVAEVMETENALVKNPRSTLNFVSSTKPENPVPFSLPGVGEFR